MVAVVAKRKTEGVGDPVERNSNSDRVRQEEILKKAERDGERAEAIYKAVDVHGEPRFGREVACFFVGPT